MLKFAEVTEDGDLAEGFKYRRNVEVVVVQVKS